MSNRNEHHTRHVGFSSILIVQLPLLTAPRGLHVGRNAHCRVNQSPPNADGDDKLDGPCAIQSNRAMLKAT